MTGIHGEFKIAALRVAKLVVPFYQQRSPLSRPVDRGPAVFRNCSGDGAELRVQSSAAETRSIVVVRKRRRTVWQQV
jgi:hypothetical protein